jgi:tRNA-splicing ligase RtcB (3'-phosphate/5'-hydroxy nucleic acid ligase)
MITGDELKKAGYPEGKAIGEAMKVINGVYQNKPDSELMNIFQKILRTPVDYINDPLLGDVAMQLMPKPRLIDGIPQTDLKENSAPYKKYGADFIEDGAVTQMDVAMKLPVTIAGALMPDAHQGYGLPIGGVLATDNTVIPYGVGVDIGCRMCLSIYDIPASDLQNNAAQYKRELIAHTKFGAGQAWTGKQKAEHPVLEKEEFNSTPLLRSLKQKASEQLGTSGGGNHFVEWGIIEVFEDDPSLNLKKGEYLALLSHSGSRGFGASIAAHYTKVAKEVCKLPQEARNLAFLGLDSHEGQEYWISMTLAGDYASACHEVIHERLTNAIGGHLLARVENHHNFAWKEIHNGKEVIVHRKGATPAGKGVLGIIPGSMTAPGFLVRGKGEEQSINSASHGAGRQMSRTAAMKSITREEMKTILKEKGVTLIGAGLDEAPMAYKDINMVMAAQTDLVEVIAKFTPKIVRMADDGSRED